jgi:opine dehydrogenase
MKIAVLGGGNGSFAAAADFALAGHEVRLWRRDKSAVDAHKGLDNKISVRDVDGKRDVRLALVTSDIASAVKGAELILCPAPATAQTDIAAALAPHLEDGQVVFLPPGTFGSVLIAKAAHDIGNVKKVAYAETGTLPWLTRKHGDFEVVITTRATRLPTGVFPLTAKDAALEIIGEAFPGAIEDCGDALSGALMNAGPIIHPPLITMNAGPLEHFETWDIHKEGTQPAIRRVTDALDQERIRIREALGYGPPHFPLANHYAKEGDERMYGRDSHKALTNSGDWREHIVLTQHRYMLEDTRIGLSFMASVAALAGVKVPLMTAFLSIGGAVAGQDFMQTGRTLESIGLGHLDKAGLQYLLANGF